MGADHKTCRTLVMFAVASRFGHGHLGHDRFGHGLNFRKVFSYHGRFGHRKKYGYLRGTTGFQSLGLSKVRTA